MCIWMTILLWFRKSSRCRTWQKGERFYLFNQHQITIFPCRWCSTCVATDLDFSRESGSVIADKMSFRWRQHFFKDLFICKGHLITLKKYTLDDDFSLLMLLLMVLSRISHTTYNILRSGCFVRNLLPLIAGYLECENICSILVEYNMINNHIPKIHKRIIKNNAEDPI